MLRKPGKANIMGICIFINILDGSFLDLFLCIYAEKKDKWIILLGVNYVCLENLDENNKDK